MFRPLILTAALVAASPSFAELITKPSAHSVTETADRLAAAIDGAGATLVARVPHSMAAASVDMELPDAILMIFGNPAVGTPVMQQDLRAGLTLPLRVLIHADGDAAALTYQTADSLFAGMDVDLASDAAQTINGALGKLTDAAAAE